MKLSDKIKHVVDSYLKTFKPAPIIEDPLTSSGVPKKYIWNWACARIWRLETENARLRRVVKIKTETLELLRMRTHIEKKDIEIIEKEAEKC